MNSHDLDDLNYPIPNAAIHYIAEMGGVALRDRVVAAFGGTTLCIPSAKPDKTVSPNSRVANVLGLDDARTLIDLVGGEKFYVPMREPASSRVVAAFRAYKAGAKPRQIARTLQISDRQVHRLLAKARDLLSKEGARSAILTGG